MKDFCEFKKFINGKNVAVVGIGVSNIPLINFLVKLGANVTGFDMKSEEALGEVAVDFKKKGVKLELGEKYSVRTSIMIPYEEFANRWNETNQAKYINLKEKVDFFASTSNTPYQSPVQLRNYQNFMVQHTDRAMMIYDPEHPGKPKYDYNLIQKYQETKEYPLDLIDFYDLQDVAEEYQENHQSSNFSE